MAKFLKEVALLRIESPGSGAIPTEVPKLRYWVADDADPEYSQRGLLTAVAITPASTWQDWWNGVIQQINTDAGI